MEETQMQISNLTKSEINTIIDLYIYHKKDFIDSKRLTIEDFIEQFCHKCDNCGKIICILDMCEECGTKREIDKDLELFDREKEHYVYGL